MDQWRTAPGTDVLPVPKLELSMTWAVAPAVNSAREAKLFIILCGLRELAIRLWRRKLHGAINRI